MSIKPQYATYRYTSELCQVTAQSIVECRLQSGEISSVLTVYAHAVPEELTCADGEVKYSGKLYMTVVYRDLDGKICRAERGAEFYHKANHEGIVPTSFARAVFKTEGIKHRREGSGFYISVVVQADLTVYGTKERECLIEGENLIARPVKSELVKTLCVSGETEEEDSFEIDGIDDLLLHVERAEVAQCFVANGKVSLIGEIVMELLALKGERLCSYERQVPFNVELPVEDCSDKLPVLPKVETKSATLNLTTDEETGKCRLHAALTLRSECLLYITESVDCVDDVFSTECELELKKEKTSSKYLTGVQRFTERIGGTVSTSLSYDGDFSVLAVTNPSVEITCKKKENGREAEGYVEAEAILQTEDGVKSAKISLPFLFPLQADGEEVKVEGRIYGLSLRRIGGKLEGDGTLKVSVASYTYKQSEYVCLAREGRAYEKNCQAISVFVPTEGDGLWEVAKKLKCSQEDVLKNNPELKFPVQKGERLFIYRCLADE